MVVYFWKDLKRKRKSGVNTPWDVAGLGTDVGTSRRDGSGKLGMRTDTL